MCVHVSTRLSVHHPTVPQQFASGRAGEIEGARAPAGAGVGQVRQPAHAADQAMEGWEAGRARADTPMVRPHRRLRVVDPEGRIIPSTSHLRRIDSRHEGFNRR